MGFFSRPHIPTAPSHPRGSSEPAAPLSIPGAALASSTAKDWLKSRFKRSKLDKPSLHSTRSLPVTPVHATASLQPAARGSIYDASPPVPTPTSAPQPHTDAVTLTLAQRLSELQTANAEGLLDDDEYRLLRQNLFERFASNSDVPSEPTLVARQARLPSLPRSTRRSLSKDKDAASSTHTNGSAAMSIASHFQSLVRKASRSGSIKADKSAPSTPLWTSSNNTLRKTDKSKEAKRLSASLTSPPSRSASLSHRPSESSLGSTRQANALYSIPATRARSHYDASTTRDHDGDKDSDTRSISSMHTTHTTQTAHSFAPSAFKFKIPQSDAYGTGYLHPTEKDRDFIYSTAALGENPSPAAVKEEIANVEREMQGLMDAFGGLEMSLAVSAGIPSAPRGSIYQSESNNGSETSLNYTPSLSGAVESSRPSLTLSPKSRSKAFMYPIGVGKRPSAELLRDAIPRTSSSSNSVYLKPLPPNPLPLNGKVPVRSSPSSTPMSVEGSLPSINGHHTLRRARLPHVDGSLGSISSPTDLSDVRRRRAEVAQRYEARLDFLRAKLKSAEMREKLRRR